MTRTKRHPRFASPIRGFGADRALALLGAIFAAIIAMPPAAAQTYTVLYSFTGEADGGQPGSGVIQDPAGNLYGTTFTGGGICTTHAYSCGAVFKLSETGKETVLHGFTGGADGRGPIAGLIGDKAGNLYGTNQAVVFEVSKNSTFTVLAGLPGWGIGGVIRDAAGNFYGTTFNGGASGYGTVFELDAAGTLNVLYSFTGGSDGGNPYAGLIRDAAGNLYGTAEFGGAPTADQPNGNGVVFELDATGKETVLHTFCSRPSCADGALPLAGVTRDSAGNLYGTTSAGGIGEVYGAGVVFKLSKKGKFNVLHSFTGGADGAGPSATGVLLRDSAGNLYGTTNAGGGSSSGVVFKLDTDGAETVLYNFCSQPSCADGASPYAGVIEDAAGNLYGTAELGGAWGSGVVFKLTP